MWVAGLQVGLILGTDWLLTTFYNFDARGSGQNGNSFHASKMRPYLWDGRYDDPCGCAKMTLRVKPPAAARYRLASEFPGLPSWPKIVDHLEFHMGGKSGIPLNVHL